MNIFVEKNLASFTPENKEEEIMLNTLWQTIIDCNGFAKKLVPVGEFVPEKGKNMAQFMIEGLGLTTNQKDSSPTVDVNCNVYCVTCNRIEKLKKGDKIPICCGKLMEVII